MIALSFIYIVEDDDNIRDLVIYALQSSGYTAKGFERAADFWQGMDLEKPDLVFLDIMLPETDGLSLLQTMRKQERTKNLPVIMLTAKSGEYDRVRGLDMGADDYITKPFSVLELISRTKAVLRRSQQKAVRKAICIGNVSIDPEKWEVLSQGEKIQLTYKEFELLFFLMQNKGLVLSREKIMEQVWGVDFEGESRTVDMHIKTLRKKLGDGGSLVQTVRNVGYRVMDE